MSLQSFTHSLQMYTDGPETSLETSSCPRPQKLHRMWWGELTRFFISSGPGADRSRLGLPLLAGLEFTDDLVHDPVGLRLLRGHEEVPVGVLLDLGQRLPRVLHENVVQRRAPGQDLLRIDIDVGRLPLAAAEGLVDHDTRVRQRGAFSIRA